MRVLPAVTRVRSTTPSRTRFEPNDTKSPQGEVAVLVVPNLRYSLLFVMKELVLVIIAIYTSSLRRNRILRSQDSAEILFTEETETEFADSDIIPLLQIHIKFGLNGRHLPPCTDPRQRIARSSIEEVVCDTRSTRRNRVNCFVSDGWQEITFVNIKAVNVEAVFKARGNTLGCNTAQLTHW